MTMKTMGRLMVGIVMAAAVAWTGFGETVTNVRGAQRENSNLVDIYYDLEASDGGSYTVEVAIEGRTDEVNAATFTGDVGDGITPGKNHHILWDLGSDWLGDNGDVRAIVTVTKQDGKHKKVRLWAGGPYWATTNIGAEKPEDYGLYFWWGDTTGYRPSSDGTFSFNFSEDNPAIYTHGKSVSELQSSGWLTDEEVLASAHDAAHVKWGGGWRLPTYQEQYDLRYTKCVWTQKTVNGVKGFVVRGRGTYASNSIFLPCAGYGYGISRELNAGKMSVDAFAPYGCYWSSSHFSHSGRYFFTWGLAVVIDEKTIGIGATSFGERYYGRSIRPVQGSTSDASGSSAWFLVNTKGCLLKFDANADDATGTMMDMRVMYGDSISLPACAFKREGYFFVGWSTDPNVNAVVHFNVETRNFDYDSMGVYRSGETWCIGDESILPDGVPLYAVWAKNYTVVLRDGRCSLTTENNVRLSLGIGDALPKNPFHAEYTPPYSSSYQPSAFIEWTTLKDIYGDTLRYKDCALWDGAGARPGDTVSLFAVWARPVKYCFYNKDINGLETLEPQELEQSIKWRCKCWNSHWHDEDVSEWHSGSETVMLPPGDHEIEFNVDNKGEPWILIDYLHGDKVTLPVINYMSGSEDDGFYGNNADWHIYKHVDVSRDDTVMVKFGCTCVYSGDEKFPFDDSRVRIRIWYKGSEYPDWIDNSEPFTVQEGSSVPLRMGKWYEVYFSYEGDNSAWRGEGFSFRPQSLYPAKREVIGNFYSQWGQDSSSTSFKITLLSDFNVDKTIFGVIGDSIYLPRLPDYGQRKFLGWYADLSWRWEKVHNGTQVTQEFLDKIHCKLYARWDESVPEIISGWLSGVTKTLAGAFSVVLPSTVVGVHANAFVACEDIESVVFEGNAPEVETGAFDGLSADCVFYVSPSSTGWNVAIPGTWNGHRIEHVDIPDMPNPVFTVQDGVLTAVDLNGATEVMIPDDVTSIGDYAFFDCSGLTSVTIPDSVTSIGEGAFCGCSGLTCVTIPDSVTSIGDYAFSDCSGLTSVMIPDSVTDIGYVAFSGGSERMSIIVAEGNLCYKSVNGLLLTKDGETLVQGINGDVVIPDGVTCIGDGAFYNCINLTSVTIPDSVTSIGYWAFEDCSGLTSVTIPDSVTSVECGAFSGCSGLMSFIVGDNNANYKSINGLLLSKDGITLIAGVNGDVTIPGSVTNIGNFAFYGCSGLTSVTIPDRVTGIGEWAFDFCYRLTSVTIPDSVTSVGDGAFCNCSGLVSVTIPDRVTDIGNHTFSSCSGMTSVTIPDSVTSIGMYAFSYCSGLTSVTFYGNAPLVESYAFYGVSSDCVACVPHDATEFDIDGDGKWNGLVVEYYTPPVFTIEDGVLVAVELNDVTDVIIPSSVTSIGAYAFEGCSELTSVTIPNSVTNIGVMAFDGCCGLTSVTIPNSVTSIGDWAFGGCRGLTSVTIPDSVTSIGRDVFEDCSGIRDVVVPQCVCNSSMASVFPTTYQSITNVVISDGVTSIGSSVFWGCIGLTSVTIGNGVTSIGQSAFYGCNGLTSVTIPSNVSIVGYEFNGCSGIRDVTVSQSVCEIGLSSVFPSAYQSITNVVISDGVTSIGYGAFDGCRELTSVIIPDGVTSIGDCTFFGCRGLTSVTIPDSVTNIGNFAFSNCSGLMSVTIGNSVTNIGYEAFGGCASLTSVTIPDSVTSIEYGVFSGCSGLRDVAVPQCVCNRGISFVFGEASQAITNVVISDGVTSIGAQAFAYCSRLTSVTIPDSVMSIGWGAFSWCSGLTSVTIPDSVTNIGGYAFLGCSGLTNVRIGNGVTSIGDSAFENCSGLTSVTIPGNVTNIGERAFAYCSGLTSVTIPDGVTSIGFSAFEGCSGLRDIAVPQCVCTNQLSSVFSSSCQSITNVTISDVVTSIGDYAFSRCSELTSVTIPDSVTSIGYCAFYGCSGLTSVTIGNSVTSIGEHAFSGCTGLTSVTIGNSVMNIRNGAFSGCSGLKSFAVASGNPNYKAVSGLLLAKDGKTLVAVPCGLESVTIPDSVTIIGDSAFYGCSGLTNVTIPDSVTGIGEGAFYDCSGLTSMTIPSSVTNIEGAAFSNCSGLKSFAVASGNPNYKAVSGLLLTKDGKTLVVTPGGLTGQVTIPDGVTSIGYCAFEGCSWLTSVMIPDGVTSIGDYAFSGCSGLTSITIPDSVTSIGGRTFAGCSGLTSIAIPDSVTSIGDLAFYYCNRMTSVTFMGNAPTVGSYAFYSVNSSCVASVSPKSTGWGVGAGEKWNGLTLQYWPEVLTVVESDADVCGIMETFSDTRLASQVWNTTEYAAFKAWVNDNNLYQPSVIANTNAAAAYLLGAERLFENAPKVEFGEVVLRENGTHGTDGTGTAISVTVTVRDGEEAVKCAAEKVKEMFEATSDLGDWADGGGAAVSSKPPYQNALPVEVEVEAGEGATMRFKVTPGDGTTTRAFLRIRK